MFGLVYFKDGSSKPITHFHPKSSRRMYFATDDADFYYSNLCCKCFYRYNINNLIIPSIPGNTKFDDSNCWQVDDTVDRIELNNKVLGDIINEQ